jgi:outer membrane protein
MMREVVAVLGWTLLAAGAAGAQEPLTVQAAVRSALQRHPIVEQAEAGVERSRAGLREVAASLLPAAQLEASLMRFQEPMVVAPLHGFDPQRPPEFERTLAQASATVGWVAFDGGGRSARVERASALLDGSRAGRRSATQGLIAEVVRRYAAVLTAREVEAAHRSRVEALDEERVRAVRLLEEGRAARVVLLRAEAALSAARAELAGSAGALETAERDLARWTGLPAERVAGADLAQIRAPGPAPEREAAVQRALDGNPELERLAAEVAAGRAGVSEARAQWWPTLHLGGRYVQYGSAAGSAGGEWQTGVQVAYPLFTGAARPAAADRARATAQSASAEHAAARLRVTDAVDRALVTLVTAERREEAWQAAVEQSAEVARIERLSLETGAGVQTDYLSAQADLLRARASLTEARSAVVVARVELARAMGELTAEWIDANLESGT